MWFIDEILAINLNIHIENFALLKALTNCYPKFSILTHQFLMQRGKVRCNAGCR